MKNVLSSFNESCLFLKRGKKLTCQTSKQTGETGFSACWNWQLLILQYYPSLNCLAWKNHFCHLKLHLKQNCGVKPGRQISSNDHLLSFHPFHTYWIIFLRCDSKLLDVYTISWYLHDIYMINTRYSHDFHSI